MAEILLNPGLLFFACRTKEWFQDRILQNKVEFASLQKVLTDQLDTIEEGITILRIQPLKTATHHHRCGMRLYFLHLQNNEDNTDASSSSWRDTLRLASQNAHEAMNQVETPEQQVQCFFIISSCISALHDKSSRTGMIEIQEAIKIILEKEGIQRALRTFKRCATTSEESPLQTQTKELLANLFQNLHSALEVFHDFGTDLPKRDRLQQRNEMREVLRDTSYSKNKNRNYLCEATDPNTATPWDDILAFCNDPRLMGLVQNPSKVRLRDFDRLVTKRGRSFVDCRIFEMTWRLMLDYCQCDSEGDYIPGKVEIRTTNDDESKEVFSTQEVVRITRRGIMVIVDEENHRGGVYDRMKSNIEKNFKQGSPAYVILGLMMHILLIYGVYCIYCLIHSFLIDKNTTPEPNFAENIQNILIKYSNEVKNRSLEWWKMDVVSNMDIYE